MDDAPQTYTVRIGDDSVILPIIPLPTDPDSADKAISLFMLTDQPVPLLTRIGAHLAARLAPLQPDVIVAPATLGIPLAIETSRALGLDRYVVLQKSPKVHLRGEHQALAQTIRSITSEGSQRLLLDRRLVPLLAGATAAGQRRRRVVVVDDVIASGGSMAGALELVRRAGGLVVGVGVILTEGWAWRDVLGVDDARLVTELGHIPQFERDEEGGWRPMEGT